MFRKIVKKIILIASAINIIILSACSSVSNLTPNKVVESDNGVYTLTMAARIGDGTLVQGSERPYVVIEGQKYLMKTVLNLRNEVMYQYNYTFPKGKDSVSYFYVIEYQSRSNKTKAVFEKSIDSGEIFVLRPLNKAVDTKQLQKAKIGSVIPIQGMGFDSSDVVYIGGADAKTECISRKILEFTVPNVSAKKQYDIEIKHGNGSSTWAGSLYVSPSDFLISPSKISRESGQTVNMIFDIGFKAPEGGFYIDVQTNIPSSVIMPEILIPEGESSVAVPVKFAAAGRGYLYINAIGFNEKVIPINVEALEMTAVELLNAQEDEVSSSSINNLSEEDVITSQTEETTEEEVPTPKTEEVTEDKVELIEETPLPENNDNVEVIVE